MAGLDGHESNPWMPGTTSFQSVKCNVLPGQIKENTKQPLYNSKHISQTTKFVGLHHIKL